MTDIMTLASPPDWQLYRLGQLFLERKQKGSDKNFPPLSVTMNGIVPQLETAAKTDDGDNRKVVRVGDYVINSRSDRKGSGGISDYEGSVSLISIVLEPRDDIEPRYAHHLLRSPAFQEEFYRWGHGIVPDLWTTRYGDMKNIRLRVPDLATQRQIADFLDRETARIDLLIEKKQRLVALLGEKARSVNELFFINANAADTQPLHRLYRVVTGKTPSRNEEGNFSDEAGLPWATPTNLGFLAPVATTKEYLTAKGCTGQPVVDAGTVLLNGIGASVGKIGIAGTKLSFNQQIHALIAKKRVLADRFLFFQLLTLKEQLVLLANSTTLPILNAERLGRLELKIFDLEEQRYHCAKMDALLQHEEIIAQRINASIDRLKEYRSALITAAVTGQIDVSTYAKSGTPDRRLDVLQEEMGA